MENRNEQKDDKKEKVSTGIAGTDISGEDSFDPESSNLGFNEGSLASDGPVSQTEGNNKKPDLTDNDSAGKQIPHS